MLTARAGGTASSSQVPGFWAGKETGLDFAGLRALLDMRVRRGKRSLVDGVTGRLFELASGEGSPEKVEQTLDALRSGLGAKYAAWIKIEDNGARVLNETAEGQSSRRSAPAALLRGSERDLLPEGRGSRRLLCDGVLWSCARSHEEFVLLAAFAEGDEDGASAFEECGGAAAEFLRRCSQAKGAPGCAEAISAALVSLVHDMRNLVTGLTLCLGAYRESRRAMRSVSAEEMGVLEGQVSTLAAMCREFDLIRLAARLEETPSAQGLSMDAIAALATGFGMHVENHASGQAIKTSATTRGILSRALVYAMVGMLELKATRLELAVCDEAAGNTVTIGFCSRLSANVQMGNETLRQACELVNARGGRAEIYIRDGRSAIEMEFAPAAAMNV